MKMSDVSGEDVNKTFVEMATKVYHASHIFYLGVFFVIYLVVFVVFKMYTPSTDANSDAHLSRVFDYLVTILLLLLLAYNFYSQQITVESVVQWSIDFYEDPFMLFGVILFIATFYSMLYILRIASDGPNAPWTVTLIMNKSWFLVATMVLFSILKYGFNVDLLMYLDNKHLADLQADLHELKHPEKLPEVFNVANNLYSYKDAQAICKSYDARLATYDDIEDAYNKGGEWCNYGWSEGQMAFFPTQKSTFDRLQKEDTQKNNCGRPGINGGYMANPHLKFGVNCFGKKPPATQQEITALETKKTQPIPVTTSDKELNDQVEKHPRSQFF